MKWLVCAALLSALIAFAKSSAQQTPAQDEVTWQFDGCYGSDRPDGILPFHVMEGDYMTQGFCRDRCHAQSFKLFGLMSGTKCFCGATVKNAWKVDSHRCTWKCAGNHKESCGGDRVMQVFRPSIGSKQKAAAAASDTKVRCSYQPDETSKDGKRLVCVANLQLYDLLGQN